LAGADSSAAASAAAVLPSASAMAACSAAASCAAISAEKSCINHKNANKSQQKRVDIRNFTKSNSPASSSASTPSKDLFIKSFSVNLRPYLPNKTADEKNRRCRYATAETFTCL
jgi:hypothetical protein